MSYSRFLPLSAFAGMLIVAATASTFAQPKSDQVKKQPQTAPVHAKAPSPAVTDDFVHREFGDGCSVLQGPQQFVADMDGDGVEDLVIAARCKNPIADRDEYGFAVADPYDTFLGFGDVRVTSTFASDEPGRRGVCLLIVHGNGTDAWRANTPKAKFVLINLPFKTLAVKRLALRKKNVLGVFMEEQGEGENTTSVIFWDGKRYRYQILGADFSD
jgi:hypothetical protein